MKRYFEILIKTLLIQIITTILALFLISYTRWDNVYYSAHADLIVFGWILSWIVDVSMAVNSQEPRYKRLIYIFLMPTNYSFVGWFIYLFYTSWETIRRIFDLYGRFD